MRPKESRELFQTRQDSDGEERERKREREGEEREKERKKEMLSETRGRDHGRIYRIYGIHRIDTPCSQLGSGVG